MAADHPATITVTLRPTPNFNTLRAALADMDARSRNRVVAELTAILKTNNRQRPN